MENWGVLVALLSSSLGGTAVGATRFLAGSVDPVTIGAIRFVGGFIVLLPLALRHGAVWPPRRDWPAVGALGVLFFAVFPILFNASLIYTTAARGALALSTLPLLTMLVAALCRVERPTPRKVSGVVIAMGGVAIALGSSATHAPDGAWRGDLLMVAAALCMALYSVRSRPYIARSGPLPFTTLAMAAGAACLAIITACRGELVRLATLDGLQWLAAAYLAIVCGAFIFFLWSYALGRAAPTLVAISVAINPVTAAIFGALLLGEPIDWRLILGLITVILGIALATGIMGRRPGPASRES